VTEPRYFFGVENNWGGIMSVNMVCLILAAICFVIEVLNSLAGPRTRVNLVALGLFFYILSLLIR
jgi:hypothetical protein